MLRKDDISVLAIPSGDEESRSLDRLFPPVEDSCRLLVSCRRGDYSASRIAMAVEDCDAHLLNLNVTSDSDNSESHIITELRISHRDPNSAVRSLERYGYEVLATEETPTGEESVMRSRYDEFMRYLGI